MKKSEEIKKQIEAMEVEVMEMIKDRDYEEWGKDPKYREISKKQRVLKNEMEYWKLREIKPYCNSCFYTDVEPYEVVRTVSEKCVEVRAMTAKQVEFPKQVHVGGFCAHVADNRSGQKYEYESNPEAPVERVRWSEANRQWQKGKYGRFSMSPAPYKFYDYNF